jgi:hypothetical protein
MPTAAPRAVQSIWDEEAARRDEPPATMPCPKCGAKMPSHAVLCLECGFSIRTGTTRTLGSASAAEQKPASPLKWLSRTWERGTNKGSIGSLRWAILLVAFGIGLFVYGVRESLLTAASSQTPETISLQKLVDCGPGGNANIILTEFQLCNNFVRAYKTVGGVDAGGAWTKVWVPAVPRQGILGFLREVPGNNIHAIIYSTHVGNENDLHRVLDVPQLHGLVVNRITSLSSKEKEILQNRYTGIDFDRCLIIEEGRIPTSSAAIFGLLGGGGLLFCAGGFLLARRFLFS